MTAETDPTPRDEEKFTIRKYNEVVRSAQLLDIRLTGSKFAVKPDYYDREHGTERATDGRELELEGGLTWARFDSEQGVVVGQFDWKAGSRKKRRKLLSIAATYLIAYRVANTSEDKYVNVFLANVGRFATYPYFRALVSQYSAASMADLPLLPVLKESITPPSDAENVGDE